MAAKDDRLVLAVERGLLPSLEPHGCRLGATTAHQRGSSGVVVGDGVQVEVHADWLEGELVVEVLRPGEQAVIAMELERLPRSVTASVLESRLRKHAEGIVAEVARGQGV